MHCSVYLCVSYSMLILLDFAHLCQVQKTFCSKFWEMFSWILDFLFMILSFMLSSCIMSFLFIHQVSIFGDDKKLKTKVFPSDAVFFLEYKDQVILLKVIILLNYGKFLRIRNAQKLDLMLYKRCTCIQTVTISSCDIIRFIHLFI